MTTVEILETEDNSLYLHIHSVNQSTTIVPIDDDQINDLERTIQDPIPIQNRGKREFEIVEGGGNELFIFIELENSMSTLIPVESEQDLEWLQQTIRSPHPFNSPSTNISRL